MQQKEMSTGVDYACAIRWGSRSPAGGIVHHKLTRVTVTELGVQRYGRPALGRQPGRYVKGIEVGEGTEIVVGARDVIGEWAKLADAIAQSQNRANTRREEAEADEAKGIALTQRIEELTGVFVLGRGGGHDRRGNRREITFCIVGTDDLATIVAALEGE